MNINNIISRIALFTIGLFFIANPLSLNALSLTTYSENSALSEGNWAKISIPKSGVYHISNTDLQKWGFSDPSKVNIYGYGGKRLPDALSSSTFIDDLPLVRVHRTDKGIVFYGQGPETWTTNEGNYIQSINPFSTEGYYFISDREPSQSSEIPVIGKDFSQSDLTNAITSFIESIYHEKDMDLRDNAKYDDVEK